MAASSWLPGRVTARYQGAGLTSESASREERRQETRHAGNFPGIWIPLILTLVMLLMIRILPPQPEQWSTGICRPDKLHVTPGAPGDSRNLSEKLTAMMKGHRARTCECGQRSSLLFTLLLARPHTWLSLMWRQDLASSRLSAPPGLHRTPRDTQWYSPIINLRFDSILEKHWCVQHPIILSRRSETTHRRNQKCYDIHGFISNNFTVRPNRRVEHKQLSMGIEQHCIALKLHMQIR